MARGADESILGREIAGKYRVDSFIGGGAMGAVYRARQRDIDKTVAVKVLHRELADPQFAARFKREAKAASRLDHPNSMRVLDFGEEPDGLCYIVMELVDGRTLFHVLREESPLARERVVDFLRQTLAALAVAHDMGVVHRDLKPENIMILRAVDDEGEVIETVKVCDFGMAKISASRHEAEELASEKLTSHGVVLGTPEYMSLEQGKGEALDGRSDLYAVGVILYQLLTGRLPFTAETPVGVLLKQLVEEPVPPSQVNPGVDPALEAVAMRAMRKRPEDRFASAREMRGALGAAASGSSLPRSASAGASSDPRLGDTQKVPAQHASVPPREPVSAARRELEQSPTTEVAIMRPARPLRLARDILSDPPPPPQRSIVPSLVGVAVLFGLAALAVVGKERWMGGTATGDVSPRVPASQVVPASAAPPGEVSSGVAAAAGGVPAGAAASDTRAPRAPGSAATTDVSPRGSARPLPPGPPGPSAALLPTVPPAPAASGAPSVAPPAEPPSAVASAAVSTTAPSAGGTAAPPAPAEPAHPPAPPSGAGAPAGSFDAARVLVGAVAAQNVRGADVREVLPLDRYDRCYRTSLRAGADRGKGSGSLHLDIDADGVISKATFAGTEPFRDAGNCIVNATLGRKVENVTSGAGDADVPLSFKAE